MTKFSKTSHLFNFSLNLFSIFLLYLGDLVAMSILLFFHYMAFLAGLLRKGFVSHFLEKFGVIGSVGDMAFPAVHLLGVDVDVGHAKGLFFIVVAFPAQWLNRLVDQGQIC